MGSPKCAWAVRLSCLGHRGRPTEEETWTGCDVLSLRLRTDSAVCRLRRRKSTSVWLNRFRLMSSRRHPQAFPYLAGYTSPEQDLESQSNAEDGTPYDGDARGHAVCPISGRATPRNLFSIKHAYRAAYIHRRSSRRSAKRMWWTTPTTPHV